MPPPAVRRIALLLAGEGAVLCAMGLGYGGGGLLGEPRDRVATVLAGIMVVLLGAGVLALARAVDDLRRWARAPAITLQLLALPVGIGLIRQVPAAALIISVLAAAVLGHFALASARDAFTPR